MKMYKAQFSWKNCIEEVDIVRKTDKSVYFSDSKMGQCQRIESEGLKFCNTWEEAHDWLMELAKGRVNNYARQLSDAKDVLGNIKGMKNPDSVKTK